MLGILYGSVGPSFSFSVSFMSRPNYLWGEGHGNHSSILAWRIPGRSLAGSSPLGHKEQDTTERLSLHFTSAIYDVTSLVAQLVKSLSAMQEIWVLFLGWENRLEKEMATHSGILAWRIPWTEGSGRLQSMGSQESDTTERLSVHTVIYEVVS